MRGAFRFIAVIAVSGTVALASAKPGTCAHRNDGRRGRFPGIHRGIPRRLDLYMEAYVTGYNTVRGQTDDAPASRHPGRIYAAGAIRSHVQDYSTSAPSSKSRAGSISAKTALHHDSEAVSTLTATRIRAAPTRFSVGPRSGYTWNRNPPSRAGDRNALKHETLISPARRIR